MADSRLCSLTYFRLVGGSTTPSGHQKAPQIQFDATGNGPRVCRVFCSVPGLCPIRAQIQQVGPVKIEPGTLISAPCRRHGHLASQMTSALRRHTHRVLRAAEPSYRQFLHMNAERRDPLPTPSTLFRQRSPGAGIGLFPCVRYAASLPRRNIATAVTRPSANLIRYGSPEIDEPVAQSAMKSSAVTTRSPA